MDESVKEQIKRVRRTRKALRIGAAKEETAKTLSLQEKKEIAKPEQPNFDHTPSLSHEEIDQERKIQAAPTGKEFKITLKTPDKSTKQLDTKQQIKSLMSEPQMHMLVDSGINTITYIINKEPLKTDQTANFSRTLFEVGTQMGWFDNMEFLPYLLLIAATMELAATVYTQPDRTGKKITMQEKPQQPQMQDVMQKEPIIADYVDEEALVNKINGR
jgi:hypothetical protein